LREGESRPFVVVDFDNSAHGFINVVVENIGRTMAEDISFEWDPPLEGTVDYPGMGYSWGITSRSIPSLPPGKRLSSLFDETYRRFADNCTLPDKYTVTVRYGSAIPPRPRYTHAINLDLGVFRGLPRIFPKSDVALVLEQIRDLLSDLAEHPSQPEPIVEAVVPGSAEAGEEGGGSGEQLGVGQTPPG
jgi:hypothetical protein